MANVDTSSTTYQNLRLRMIRLFEGVIPTPYTDEATVKLNNHQLKLVG